MICSADVPVGSRWCGNVPFCSALLRSSRACRAICLLPPASIRCLVRQARSFLLVWSAVRISAPLRMNIDTVRAFARQVWQEFAAAARRASRTKLCSLLRDERNAALHLAWTEEYSQTSADSRRRVQHRLGDAQNVGRGHAARAEEPRAGPLLARFCAPHRPMPASKPDSKLYGPSFRSDQWISRSGSQLLTGLKMAGYTTGC